MEATTMNLLEIPQSFLIVIDDVGWWCGKDQRHKNGPSRTGLECRRHSVHDYKAVIEIGKSLNMRILCGFTIGEWDRTNVLAKVRNSNKYGTSWDNASRLDPSIDEARDLINESCEHIEMAIHGLVHWYWDGNGKLLGPEFYQRETEQNNLVMTHPDIVREHLDAYFEIYRQNGLSADIRSYIPPCFCHVYSNKEDHISYILSQYGIRYISTPFCSMGYTSGMELQDVCVENGIINVDRTRDLIHWATVGAAPPDKIKSGYFGMHWPNILHPDVEKNTEIVQEWIRYFNRYRNRFDIFIAKNNAMASRQALYRKYTAVDGSQDLIRLDFRMLDASGARDPGSSLYINIRHPLMPVSDQSADMEVYEVHEEFTTYRLTRRPTGGAMTMIKLKPMIGRKEAGHESVRAHGKAGHYGISRNTALIF
jgi:hypothetical protein